MFTCMFCEEKFNYNDEVTHYNINDESVPNDELSLERNAQNPDYAPYVLCNTCDEERQDAGVTIEQVIQIIHENDERNEQAI
jgi:hypothetical protein